MAGGGGAGGAGARRGSGGAVADPGAPAVQALVRGDPAGYAARELAERRAIGLPPAVTTAGITGPLAAVTAVLAALELSPSTVVNGPVPLPATDTDEPWRTVLRAPVDQAGDLARALHAVASARSARRETPVRIQIDPRDLG